jgi:hypothetical protein
MNRWSQTMMSLILIGVIAMTGVRPALAIDMPYLSGTTNSGLTNPPDDETTLNWVGTYGPVNNGKNFYATVHCTGTDCYKVPFFLDADVTVNYSDIMGHAPYKIRWNFNSVDGVDHYGDVTCSTTDVRSPVRRTCTLHLSLMIPADEIHSATNAAHIGFVLTGVNEGSQYSQVWTVDITISGEPINATECDDAYENQGIAQDGEVDPTSETGSTVDNLIVGSDYRLTVTGGPWVSADAPTLNRYDTAVKVDDDEWQQIELAAMQDNVICRQGSDDGHSVSMVFEATDTDWAIRVDDIVGYFADNSYTDDPITWELVKVVPTTADTGCGGQFLQGNLLGSYVLDGKDSDGERIMIPAPGKWVQVVVQDDTFWQDDGAGPELRTIAIEPGQLPWFTLEAYPFSQCADTTLGIYYFQVANPGSHLLRVADTGSNWAANTGSLSINVYSATYDPYPAECEGHYNIGDMIETKVVAGNSPTGITMNDGENSYPPLPIGGERNDTYRYFMMEIVNGPFWDGIAYSAATDVYYGPSATWYPSIIFPTATCVSILDGLGRTRIYFPYDTSIERNQDGTFPTPWKFRPHDGDSSWGNNTGYIGYTLYRADFLDVDDCDTFYTPDVTGDPITVMGNDSDGSGILSLEPGAIYAVETSSGPWVDGAVSKYDIAFSMDDGDTWEAVQTSDMFLCKAEDGNYITAYFQALEGADYRVRVNDDDGDFGDNSGWMHVTLYEVTQNIDPWGSCADDFVLGDEIVVTDAQRLVWAYDEDGLQLPLDAGHMYAVEIGENVWTDLGGSAYFGSSSHTASLSNAPNTGFISRFAEISNTTTQDGTPGNDWSAFEDAPGATCVVKIPDPADANKDRYRIYFMLIGTYSVRVNDQDGNWGNNTGNLDLHYFSADGTEPDDDNNILPPFWTTSCYEPCMRPSSLITWITVDFGTLGSLSFPVPDVGGWLEYARCAIQKYFAWCPEHTAYLQSLTDIVTAEKDPFATAADLGDFYSYAKQRVESTGLTAGGESNWPLSGGGEPADGNVMDVLTPGLDRGSNPWFGGQVDLAAGYSQGGETPIVLNTCSALSAVDQYWGDPVMFGVCRIVVTLKTSPIFQVLFTVMDMLLAIFMVFRYIPKTLNRLWNMIVKNKGLVRTVIQ